MCTDAVLHVDGTHTLPPSLLHHPMAASSPLAASPGRVTGLQTMASTVGYGTMAAGTPTTASVHESGAAGNPGSTATASMMPPPPTTVAAPSLFDESHIPTLRQRIQTLSHLLIDASNDPKSLSIPQAREATHAQTAQMGASASPSSRAGPDIAMGATTEDDVVSGYEAALALSLESGGQDEKNKRTELAHRIIIESQGLRDAFLRATEAANCLEGGEMDIDEQQVLIKLLQDYCQEQR